MKKQVLSLAAGLLCAAIAGSASAASGPTIGVAEFTNQTAASWGRGGVNRRARRGRGDRHRLIVTSSRRQACGGKCRIPSQARVTLAGLYR